MEPVENNKVSAESETEGSEFGEQEARQSTRFWPVLLGSMAAHTALIWALEAIPVHNNEFLGLRWIRALAEHPVRGPLGLALALVGVVQLVRAMQGRSSRA